MDEKGKEKKKTEMKRWDPLLPKMTCEKGRKEGKKEDRIVTKIGRGKEKK